MRYVVILNILIVLLGLGGCKTIPRWLARPAVDSLPALAVPATYAGGTDSASVGNLSWREFFTDPYLRQLIDSALVGNPDVQIALQRIEVARAGVLNARAALLPQVNAVATVGFDRYGRYTLNGVGNFDTNLSGNVTGASQIPNPTPDYFLGLRSTWEVDLWGKLRNRRRAAQLRVLASETGRHVVQTALVAEVGRLYYALVTLDNELDIIRENAALQQRALELVTVQKQAGRVTELAVQQFRAQLLNTRALDGQVRQRIVETENELNRLLGRYPQPVRRGPPMEEQQLPTRYVAGVPAQLLGRRPDVRQAELALRATDVDVAVAQAEFLPTLTITPYVGFNAFRPGVLFAPGSLALGILDGLTAPILNRRGLRANLNLTTAQRREAYETYRRTLLAGVSEVATDLQGLANLQQVAGLQTEEVAVWRQAARTSEDLFANGYAAYLEVINAQRSALDAELALITTKRAQFLTLIDLYRSLGGGWR